MVKIEADPRDVDENRSRVNNKQAAELPFNYPLNLAENVQPDINAQILAEFKRLNTNIETLILHITNL
jgi:hypothetical protein